VLRALGERGIEPRHVAGSSAGAIVGALYAAGYTPAEMLEFFVERNPFKVSKLALSGPGFLDTRKIQTDFEDYFPDDRFEALGKRLTVVATNILVGEPVVFETGPLIRAVLASAAVPMVFTPEEIGDGAFADGGIVNNFPAELLVGRCRSILGVYATPLRSMQRSDLSSSVAVFRRAWDVGMYQTARPKFDLCDLLLCPDALNAIGTFETKHFDRIEAIGYDAAMAQMDRIEQICSA
jgi:NTE family protein